MPYDKTYYQERVNYIKKQINVCFVANMQLESEVHSFDNRGYFKLDYCYVPLNYRIIMENEYRKLQIYIKDMDGASNSLYDIKHYDSNIDYLDNILKVIVLLSKVLEQNKFPLYFSEDDRYYKKTSEGIFPIPDVMAEFYPAKQKTSYERLKEYICALFR